MPPIPPTGPGLFRAYVVSNISPSQPNWHIPVTVLHLHGGDAYVYVTDEDWQVQPFPLRDRMRPGAVTAIPITRLVIGNG